jgi:hypothetical protein
MSKLTIKRRGCNASGPHVHDPRSGEVPAPVAVPAAPSGPGGQQGSGGGAKITDAYSLLKGHARNLLMEIRTATSVAPNPTTRLHLQDIAGRLSDALDKK